jgi:hypothetical protein
MLVVFQFNSKNLIQFLIKFEIQVAFHFNDQYFI